MPSENNATFLSAAPATSPIDRRSLAQEAYVLIKRLILSGELKGDEKIPEEGIAQRLNISRTPIREALRQLAQYGLVEIKPRSYAKVASITAGEAEEIANIRVELERFAARSLLRVVTADCLRALSGLAADCRDLLRKGKVAEAFELDSAFHLEMVRRSRNRVTYDILERLDAKNQLMRLRPTLPLDKHSQYVLDHFRMIELLRERDEAGLLGLIETHLLHDF